MSAPKPAGEVNSVPPTQVRIVKVRGGYRGKLALKGLAGFALSKTRLLPVLAGYMCDLYFIAITE